MQQRKQAAKALASLCMCQGLPEPSKQFDCTKILGAG